MSKKKPLPPRVKRMTRQGRLDVGRAWLTKYEGKHVLRSYCKHFAVNYEALYDLELGQMACDEEPL